jgi:hypothetical protein
MAWPRWISAWLFIAGLTAEPSSGATFIRLVDAPTGTPLEFWVKDVDLPGGGKMCYRMPQKLYVDGSPLDFARYGQDGKALADTEAVKPGTEVAEFIAEMGAAGPRDAEVKSNRRLEVLGGTGPKALVQAALDPGDHVILPGGGKFTLNTASEPSTSDPALDVNKRDGSLLLLCQPLDINFLPIRGAPNPIRLEVESDGKPVFGDSLFVGRTPVVLRLYLPLSATGYSIKAGTLGSFRLALEPKGARLIGEPHLLAGAGIEVGGFTISIYPTGEAPASSPTTASRP